MGEMEAARFAGMMAVKKEHMADFAATLSKKANRMLVR